MVMFLATFVAFGLGILGLAVGMFFGRRPPSGSCGGLANLCDGSGESMCDICPNRQEGSST